ncbi:MAG TPA: ImmA/IrrE family metallo-endopeptidase [Pyrinomonadaceae bacterium]|jgi:Zn-dependent peptidase ImmA (M78 family)|nr:ImmA/IrrE family metallo-endopeptidase [Pyrinomonadaceae bacterium]
MNDKAKAAVRKILDRFGPKIPVDIDAIVKAHGIEVFTDNEMATSVSGVLIIKGKQVGAMVNMSHPEVRIRFTLAHELGHYLLHRRKKNLFVDEFAVMYRSSMPGGIDPLEVEANIFAAELLMPEGAVRADFKADPPIAKSDDAIRKLARRYMVSPAAMKYRLRQLGLISG